MKIVLTRRSADYHACLEGRTGDWECGTTASEAIGKLVMSHGREFGIQVAVKSDPPRTRPSKDEIPLPRR